MFREKIKSIVNGLLHFKAVMSKLENIGVPP